MNRDTKAHKKKESAAKNPKPEEHSPEAGIEPDAAEELAEEVFEESAETACEDFTKAEFEELNNRYMRLAADFQNYRRRSEQERAAVFAVANERFATELLDVMDNFERALEGDDAPAPEDKFGEGMQLILRQLRGVLENNNVSEIQAEGKKFDPNIHDAVMTESLEGYESGTVTKVFKKGYIMNEKVIRHAVVAVAE